MDANPPAVVIEKTSQDLSEQSGDVLVAERIFPSSKYKWVYQKSYVSAVRAQLELHGRRTELRTEMDSKGSRLILWIEPKPPELIAKGKVLK